MNRVSWGDEGEGGAANTVKKLPYVAIVVIITNICGVFFLRTRVVVVLCMANNCVCAVSIFFCSDDERW